VTGGVELDKTCSNILHYSKVFGFSFNARHLALATSYLPGLTEPIICKRSGNVRFLVEKLNIWGSSLSLVHPFGATGGVRILAVREFSSSSKTRHRHFAFRPMKRTDELGNKFFSNEELKHVQLRYTLPAVLENSNRALVERIEHVRWDFGMAITCITFVLGIAAKNGYDYLKDKTIEATQKTYNVWEPLDSYENRHKYAALYEKRKLEMAEERAAKEAAGVPRYHGENMPKFTVLLDPPNMNHSEKESFNQPDERIL